MLDKGIKSVRNFLEFIKEPMLAVIAALLISQFIMAHTKIPTGSMISTINIGDHLIVNRLPYYYRDPQREELIVFRHEGQNLIKRVIGEPGDIIDIYDGKVFINDEELDETTYIRVFESTEAQHELDFPYTVPEDYYFVMGDNRQESYDSRYFGPIHRDTIFAKGGFRIYPFDAIGIVK